LSKDDWQVRLVADTDYAGVVGNDAADLALFILLVIRRDPLRLLTFDLK
jgi:hypothetical protein